MDPRTGEILAMANLDAGKNGHAAHAQLSTTWP